MFAALSICPGRLTASLWAISWRAGRAPISVDGFFDAVLVNVEDDRLKANRLAILAGLVASMNLVGDLAVIGADMGKSGGFINLATVRPSDASMSDLLGGKGANLAEMSRLGLRYPHATDICHYFNHNDGQLPDALRPKLSAALKKWVPLGVAFGDAVAPLLVSVRSGSRASMPA